MRFDTLALHAAYDEPEDTAMPPICLDVEPHLGSMDDAEAIYELIDPMVPPLAASMFTASVLEERVAALEGGVSAIATSSGKAALAVSILNLVSHGKKIVCCGKINNDTRFFLDGLKKYKINVTFCNFDGLSSSIDESTCAVFIETREGFHAWPFLVKDVSQICKQKGVPFLVDNTRGAVGYLFKPIEHGADIVISSSGHIVTGNHTVHAGLIIDSGTFDWSIGRFRDLMSSSQGLVRMDYVQSFGNYGGVNLAFSVRCREQTLHDMGLQLDGFGSFLMLHGLATVSLRMERQCSNAKALQAWIKTQRKVGWVRSNVETLDSFEGQAPGGFIIAFALYGGVECIPSFLGGLSLCCITKDTSMAGDIQTRMFRTSDETICADEFLMLSVGIEAVQDLQDDLAHAFSSCIGPVRPVTPVEDPYSYEPDDFEDEIGAVQESGIRTPDHFDEDVMNKLHDDLKQCENELDKMRDQKQKLENEMVQLEQKLDAKSKACIIL